MLSIKQIVKDYHESGNSMAEVLPWMSMVSPGLVLNKDGSLLACFEFAGVDIDGMEQNIIDSYAVLVEHAFREFHDRVILWSRVDRRRSLYYPSAKFPDPVSQFIDDQRKEEFAQGNNYTNRHYFSVLLRPQHGSDGFFDRIAHYVNTERISTPAAILKAAKLSLTKSSMYTFQMEELKANMLLFEDMLQNLVSTLGEMNLGRLVDEELLGFLYSTANPASEMRSVRLPDRLSFLDGQLCGDSILIEDDHIHCENGDSVFASAVSLKEWPDITVPGMFDDLLALPGEITFSQVYRFVEHDDAKSFIRDRQRHNLNMTMGLKSMMREHVTGEASQMRNTDKELAAQDAEDAYTELTAHGLAYGYYNCTVTAYGATREESDEVLKMVSSTIKRRGFITLREKMHLLSAWAGTIPGQWGELVRWQFLSTANLSDLCPVRTISMGEPKNGYLSEQRRIQSPALSVLSTEYSTPYYFNFHQGDLGHALVVGPSRTGKSVFMNFALSQFRKYHPTNIFIFDKNYSCKIPTLLQGGQHIDFNNESSEIRLNPLKLLGDRNNWQWLSGFLETLITARGYRMTTEDAKAVWDALETTHAGDPALWRLSTLRIHLPRELEAELEPWCYGGQWGRYFDNDEDSFSLGDMTCMEMGGLLTNEHLAMAVLEYVFYRIKLRLEKLSGAPSVIYIEEAWFMLSNPRFAPKIEDWLKTIAKQMGIVIMATQSIDDLARSDVFASISDNVPTRIFLPNDKADAYRDMYRLKFGLNDAQIDRIRGAIRKRNYYVTTPTMSRMVEVSFTPEVLACLRSDTLGLQIFDKHYRTRDKNQNWQFDYVKEITHATRFQHAEE